MKIRVKFSKRGVLKYIGHLDVMRYFQKAFRRTDINVSYSTGFSPHMIMSFAHPLGVGLESDGEYFDVELEDEENTDEIKDKLNEVMAEGIEVLCVTKLSDKTGNAMASVKAASYEIVFEKMPFDNDTIVRFNDMETIEFTKKTKKNEATFNIKDYVYDISITDNNTLLFTVDASSSGNLKPAFLIDSLCELENIKEDIKYHIFRKEIYQYDKDQKLVPLYINIEKD